MLNVVALQGRLTADPELKHTPNNVAVTSFSLAVDRNHVPQGQERQADFFTIVAWRGTAEFICKYFQKGQMIALSGSLQSRKWEDRDGNKRTSIEVVASEVNFCGRKEDGKQESDRAYSEPAPAYSSGSVEDFEEILGDDLPF